MTSGRRTFCAGTAVVIACAWWALVPVTVQAQSAAAKPWSTPRTPWGDPDLQGVWTTWDQTPFEAPDPNAPSSRGRTSDAFREGAADASGSGMAIIYYGPVSPRRPGALVIDPPNGRVPVIPARRKAQDIRALGDHWVNHGAWARGITRGVPGRLLQGGIGGYSRAYQLLQTPGYAVIFTESIHDARFVPLDGRPHINPAIRQWNGDSRGHWEGDVLVVETTNFNDKGEGRSGAPQTETLHLVERFMRIDEKTIDYRVTFEDPNAYTRPWTARQIHLLDPTFVLHEVAFHEGNRRYMEGSLESGRIRDAEEAAAAAKKKAGN